MLLGALLMPTLHADADDGATGVRLDDSANVGIPSQAERPEDMDAWTEANCIQWDDEGACVAVPMTPAKEIQYSSAMIVEEYVVAGQPVDGVAAEVDADAWIEANCLQRDEEGDCIRTPGLPHTPAQIRHYESTEAEHGP